MASSSLKTGVDLGDVGRHRQYLLLAQRPEAGALVRG